MPISLITADGEWLTHHALQAGACEVAKDDTRQRKVVLKKARHDLHADGYKYELEVWSPDYAYNPEIKAFFSLPAAREGFTSLKDEYRLTRMSPRHQLREAGFSSEGVRNEDPGTYATKRPSPTGEELTAAEDKLIAQALEILENRMLRGPALESPTASADYIKLRLADAEREVFGMLSLDNRHSVLAVDDLFFGTIDAASVYPREVVKTALQHNAAAVIIYHNHPSGVAEPSQADRNITGKLQAALDTVGIRLLDHIVVGGATHVAFSERGWV